jgi:elongator complex protein 3
VKPEHAARDGASFASHTRHTRHARHASAPDAPALRAAVLAVCELIAEHERGDRPGPLPEVVLRSVLRLHPRDGRGFFSRAELIAGFRALPPGAGRASAPSEPAFVARLRMRPVRTQSGVTPVTVLTKPFPCPGSCVFCPNDVRMPKSYLSREPGCQRAEQNGFDPYLQTYNRLRAFRALGHSVDKIELIVLGGTWSSYPARYQRWFVLRCLDALDDFGRGVDRRHEAGATPDAANAEADLQHGLTPVSAVLSGAATDMEPARSPVHTRYNRALLQLGRGRAALGEAASPLDLQRAQRRNELAACRQVGLVLETRPDLIDEREVLRLRELGCTKVQLGLQSLSDDVLARNRRGHDVAASRRALRLLREAGFKLQVHWMPNLLGSSPERDVADFARMFDDPDFRPDELKVYPCSVVPGTELSELHELGQFTPYTHAQLLDVLTAVLASTPRYCRLSRMVRDISTQDIVAGNRRANFRELAQAALAARGQLVEEIRSREIKHAAFEPGALALRASEYATAVGQEHFLELCTAQDELCGLLRLSLPGRASFVAELGRSAVIRELHVYGEALALGAHGAAGAQHRGLGARLVADAARRARELGYARLAVISAVGTRGYYRRLGFEHGALYQHLAL